MFTKGQSGNPGGRFLKGQSGNPGGRPKGVAAIRDLIQARGEDLIAQLMRMALAAETEDRTRIEAIKTLLDRGYGKPPQPQTDEDDGEPVRYEIVWGGVQKGHSPEPDLISSNR